jgi:3-hydroxybutyryl-CoA dehydrogenase
MPLVEIITAEQSDESALELATNAAKDWDKVPVRAKDTPGFIVNRVARGFYLEALRMLGEGVAAVHTIDNAMRALGKFRMGPFQLMDLVGLDVNYAVSCSVWEQSGKPPRLKPHDIQRELVVEGRLGRKSKHGFYRYESDPPVVNVEIDVQPFTPPAELAEAVKRFTHRAALCDQETLNGATDVERYAFARILATIMNEAAMALEEKVATAADIDTAMRDGTNYPQGPCEWADKTGRDRVTPLLNALDQTTGDKRFAPSKAL